MNEENHMGWKLVSGVRRDVVNLFKRFGETNSVRFEDFCQVWREMKFSLIFSNRVSFMELLEFTEEILQIVKEYLFSVYEFHTRVAAIYTLYGLYFKQPIIGGAKIRLTKTEWEELFSLIETSKAEKHYDIAFIFIKLYLNGAYTFTATVRPAGLERGFRKYSERRSSLNTKVCDLELLYRPLISENLVNSLVRLESLYCKKKSELLGKNNLVFIDGKFAESLREELKNYENASFNVRNKCQSVIEGPSTSESQPKTSEEGPSESKAVARISRGKGNPKLGRNEETDGGIPNKKKKSSKQYLELMARKKAEFYIEKLKEENEVESPESYPGLKPLLDFDFSKEKEEF